MPDGHWKGRQSIKSSSVVLRRLLWTCLTLWHACLSRSSPTSHCSLAHFPNYFSSHHSLLLIALTFRLEDQEQPAPQYPSALCSQDA